MRVLVTPPSQAETQEPQDDLLEDLTPEADIDAAAPTAVADQQAATHDHVASVVGQMNTNPPAHVTLQPQAHAAPTPPPTPQVPPQPVPPPQPTAAPTATPAPTPAPQQAHPPVQNLAATPQAPQPITITPVAPAAINVQPVAPVLAAAVPAAAALAAAPAQAPEPDQTPPEAAPTPHAEPETATDATPPPTPKASQDEGGAKEEKPDKEPSPKKVGRVRSFFRRLRQKPLKTALYTGTLGIGYLCHKSYQKFYGTKLKFWDWLKGGKQMDEVKEKKGGITKKVGAWFKDWRRVLLAAEVVFVPWSIPLVALAGAASLPSLAIIGGKGVDLALNGTKHEWLGWLRRGSKKAGDKPKDK